MTPLAFGLDGRRLYGVYHPAASGAKGVVLVPPLGQEALRAHRALRILAGALAAAGWHVLRFDPYGTGDSGGGELDVTLDGLVADARTAAAELTSLSGARQLVLAGLRHGASVALLAARDTPSVRGLMLWEPVIDGAEWGRDVGANGNTTEIQGFRYGAPLLSALLRMDAASLTADGGALPKRGVLVYGAESPGRAAFAERLGARIERLEVATVLAPAPWTEENDFGAGPVPAASIAALTGWRG